MNFQLYELYNLRAEHGHTWGSKTFQYPEENKSIDIASVAASERAGAQTAVRSTATVDL